MARFFIRRNHPYTGVLTLCKIPGGCFVAKEMIVSEAEFIAEVVHYMKALSPAEKSKIRREAPAPAPAAERPPSNGEKKFRVAKAASVAT